MIDGQVFVAHLHFADVEYSLDGNGADREVRRSAGVHLDQHAVVERSPGAKATLLIVADQDELLDALWQDQMVQPEVIKGLILALRKTLGDKARSPRYIETEFKRGYRFLADVSESGSDATRATTLLHSRGRMVGRDAVATTLLDVLAYTDEAVAETLDGPNHDV